MGDTKLCGVQPTNSRRPLPSLAFHIAALIRYAGEAWTVKISVSTGRDRPTYNVTISTFDLQWRDEAESCSIHSSLNSTSCHDGVDLPLYFEDTAILYGICAAFLVLAALSFVCGNGLKATLPVGLLHSIKLVGVWPRV